MSQLEQLSNHIKCIGGYYLNDENNPKRVPVNSEKYCPDDHTSKYILENKPVWADPEDVSSIDFNKRFRDRFVENDTNFYNFDFDIQNRPFNPVGRTGLRGRGVLGKWGPNTAADPLVTRWKRDEDNQIMMDSNGNKILQFIAIKRKDNGEFALPGGMVEPDESLSLTAKREFGEEALNSLEMSPEEVTQLKQNIDRFFSENRCIYAGYVDDPRNTDNAWMVTKCFLWHDEVGNIMNNFKLQAGDDACGVQWIDYSPNTDINLYASHSSWVKHAYNLLT
jgi:ADP-ribose pyrophosphatase